MSKVARSQDILLPYNEICTCRYYCFYGRFVQLYMLDCSLIVFLNGTFTMGFKLFVYV